MNNTRNGLTILDLEIQKGELSERIRILEKKLSEETAELRSHIILGRLLEVEKSNLVRVSFELEKRRQQISTGLSVEE